MNTTQELRPFNDNWNRENVAEPAPKLTAAEAIERLNALRALTEQTGTITTRSQNRILRSLSDEVMIEVALLLKAVQQ